MVLMHAGVFTYRKRSHSVNSIAVLDRPLQYLNFSIKYRP
jgi:hypothetical protein